MNQTRIVGGFEEELLALIQDVQSHREAKCLEVQALTKLIAAFDAVIAHYKAALMNHRRKLFESVTEEAQPNAEESAVPKHVKNPDAVLLGRLGGKKGGKARMANMAPEQRQQLATKAVNARWHPPEEDTCSQCGVLMREHPRCAGCGILVGPNHMEQDVIEGYCSGCAKGREKGASE
ncbi:MAG: hypothetical protein Q7O66_16585 [Dehalococcoidia bacterium]|nr:hypothetical protein [Dehalococcoidia bacterium]